MKGAHLVCAWAVVMGMAAARPSAQTTGLRPNPVAGLGDPVAPPVGEPVSRYYTEAQATRGRTQFLRNCGVCHAAPPLVTRDMLPPEAGFYRTEHTIIPLGGGFVRKYPSLYHLFRRLRDTMPAGNPAAVGPAAKLEILAFLLKAGGFPAGTTPLPLDVERLKRMPLNEQGFDIVFNGTDLTGVGAVLGFMCKPAPLGCGTTNPGATLRADAVKRELVYSGQPEGYWYPDRQYRDFDMRFDMLFERPADADPADDFFDGNGGVLFPVHEHFVFPPTGSRVEVQGHNLNLMAILTKGSLLDPETRQRVQRPIGQWNAIRIVNQKGTVTTYINGALIGQGPNPYRESGPGYIIVQMEGVPMRWRNIRVKALAD